MGMNLLPVFILLLLIWFCNSDDRLTPAKPLSNGDMLISDGGIFALGFFSPWQTQPKTHMSAYGTTTSPSEHMCGSHTTTALSLAAPLVSLF